MDVFGWLREQGYEIDTEIYDHISLWHAWYKGKVDRVHKYWVYNGRNKIPCQRLTLNMAKQVCQDWADLLLNEKVHINQNSKTTEDFIVSVLDANNFWVRGNQAIENAFWSGLVACHPYPTNVETSSDGDITNANGISLSFSVGEQIIPLLVVNGECLECAFMHNSAIGEKKYCLLKMYTKPGQTYVVRNKVFDITNNIFTEVENFRSLKPFENLVAEYIDNNENNHVLYRVTPIYEGDNLLVSGVQMEAWSVEDNGTGLHFNVYCYNVQPGIIIDYATGESHAE